MEKNVSSQEACQLVFIFVKPPDLLICLWWLSLPPCSVTDEQALVYLTLFVGFGFEIQFPWLLYNLDYLMVLRKFMILQMTQICFT